MKKLYLVAATLLLSVWVFAQSTSPSGLTPQSSEQAAGADRAGQAIEGCLAGSGGTFTLTDGSGKIYQLAGDTAKLSEHVGHTLKIWGSEKPAGADPQGASGNGQLTFTVQKVKMVSGSCPTSK